jgi:hypothetical protein
MSELPVAKNWTPGPWKVFQAPSNFQKGKLFVRPDVGETPICIVGSDRHHRVRWANAHVLAAAPELLNELIATRAVLEAIEAHCVNERGLQGIDHADEGKRIRAALQAILAAPTAITKATRS